MPPTKVTTAITAATPMTTPRSVSTDLSLLAQSDCNAILMASVMCMKNPLGFRHLAFSFYNRLLPTQGPSPSALSLAGSCAWVHVYSAWLLCGGSRAAKDPLRKTTWQQRPDAQNLERLLIGRAL